MRKNTLYKTLILAACFALSMGALTGCKKSADNTNTNEQLGETGTNAKGAKTLTKEYCELDYNPADYVTVGNYIGLEAYQIKEDVPDEMVDEEIETVLYDYIEYGDIDRGIKNEDLITLTFTGTVDGTVDDYLCGEEYTMTAGNEDLFPGFDEALLGKKAGDHFSLDVHFPEDYYEPDYANTDAHFEVDIVAAQEVTMMPTLNDEFVQSISEDCKTVDEYKEYMRGIVQAQFDLQNYQTMQTDLWNQLVESSQFKELPDTLYAKYETAAQEELEASAEGWGISVEEFLEFFVGQTFEEYAESMAKNDLLEEAIIQKENLILTDAAYKKMVEDSLEDIDCISFEEAEETYGQEALFLYMREQMLFNFLASKANISFVSEEEYYQMMYGDDYDEMSGDEEFLEDDFSEDIEYEEIDEEGFYEDIEEDVSSEDEAPEE